MATKTPQILPNFSPLFYFRPNYQCENYARILKWTKSFTNMIEYNTVYGTLKLI